MAKDVVTLWWFCQSCQRRFRSPCYEPMCGPCCDYWGRGDRWTLFEKAFVGAILIALVILMMVWSRPKPTPDCAWQWREEPDNGITLYRPAGCPDIVINGSSR